MTETSARHFGYIAVKADGSLDYTVLSRALDEPNLAEFLACTKVITELQPLAIAYEICRTNWDVLANLSTQQARRLAEFTAPDLPTALVIDLMVEAMDVVTALLGSTSAFLGQSTVAVSRMFGKDSATNLEWHRRRKALHAASLGYRLMYELRNFAQHHSLPISAISLDGQRQGGAGSMSFSTAICLDRDELLKSDFAWGKRAADIAAQQREFELLPLFSEYLACLRTLLLEIVNTRTEELSRCSDYLAAVRRVTKAPPNARLYLFRGPGTKGASPPTSGEIVPEEQFTWLLKCLAAARQSGEYGVT